MKQPSELPLGFGMALAENQTALKHFSNLSDSEKQTVIDGTHSIRSKQEMHQYVERLAKQDML